MATTKKEPVATEPRSERGRRLRRLDVVAPIDQIRVQDAGGNIEATGAYAYYINPNGATISDALILYPNGGVPDIENRALRARYGENAAYYQQRQKNKGLEFVGVTLTAGGIRRLIAVLEKNRPDEILFMEDEIKDAEQIASTSDRPEVRDQAKRRIQQLTRRLEYLNQPLDGDALETELNDIARAQQLAKVDPNVLRVMKGLIGEVDARMEGMIARFQKTGPSGDSGGSFEGVAALEA